MKTFFALAMTLSVLAASATAMYAPDKAQTERQRAVAKTIARFQNNKDVFCDICVVVIQDLDNFITDETTEEDIIQFVENICIPFGLIADSLEQFCRNLIEQNLPQIIEDIVNNNLSPTQICGPDGLGLC